MAAKKRSGLLFLFIILLLLGLVIYAYKDKFVVLYKTGNFAIKKYFENKFGNNSNKEDGNKNSISEKISLLEKKDKEKVKAKEENKIKKEIIEINDNNKKTQKEIIAKKEAVEESNKEAPVEQKIEKKKTETSMKKNNENKNQNEKNDQKINSRKSVIYFTKIDEKDRLRMVKVTRDVYYTDMPLTETLKMLLKGPNINESSNEIISNIPQKTKLISVYIKNNVAYINLSGDFEYNSYGRESMMAQIKQIVYTTTEFSNIKSVQFLIEGKIKTYLGGEGVTINKPLSRNDLS